MSKFVFAFIVFISLSFSLILWADEELTQVYQNALEEYNHKNYSQAANELKKFMAQSTSQNRLLPEVIYLLAQVYNQQENYALALEYYQVFIKNYPDHGKIGDVLLSMGKAYYALKEYVNAQAVFQKIYNDYPTTFQAVEAMQMESLCYMSQNDLAEAEKAITRLLKKYPRHNLSQESLYILGKAWLEIGAFPQARKTFQHLLDLDPSQENAASAYYGLGWTTYREGFSKEKQVEIFNSLNQVIEKYPQSAYAPQSLFLMAQIAQEQGMYPLAVEKYQQLIDEFPFSEQKAETIFNLAKTYQKMGKKPESRATLEKLTEKYPNSKFTPNAYFLLGQSSQEDGDCNTAIEIYIHIINQISTSFSSEQEANWKPFFRLASENFLKCVNEMQDKDFSLDSYFLLAESSLKIGDYNAALQHYLLIAKELPPADNRFFKAQLGQASIYLQKKETEKARRIYQDLLAGASEPQKVIQLTTFLAQGYYQENNYDKAIELLTNITQQYPTVSETSFAFYWLGQIYFQKQLYSQAIVNFTTSSKLKEEQEVVLPEVLYKLAYCHYKEKNFVEAFKILEKLLDRFPKALEVVKGTFLLANIHFEMGNNFQALEYYNKITNLFSDSPIAPLAQYRLAVISLRNRKYTQAGLEFNQFLISYPQHDLGNKSRFALAFSNFLAEDWEGARNNLLSFIKNTSQNELTEEAFFLLFLEAQKNNNPSSALKYAQDIENYFSQSPYIFEIKITQADSQISNSLAILQELSTKDFHLGAAEVFQENSKEVNKALLPFAEMLKVTQQELREKHLQKLQKIIIETPLNESKYY